MALGISSTNTTPYNFYSEGDESNPLRINIVIDNTGGTVESDVLTAYLIATDYQYNNIQLEPKNEDTGINWQISLDGTTFAEFINPNDIDASTSDQVVPIYLKAIAVNDGTLNTGFYISCNIEIYAEEI